MSAQIPDSTHIPTRVMISSVMRDREADRETIARVIEELGDIPWYADNPPHEFSNISGETLSFRMAEDCDLYLLIIFPRYGTVFDGDPRSVTHQEFDRARQVNPYKVEVFIAAEAKANPESDALRNFMNEVSNFREGYSPHIFTSVSELREQVLAALVTWRDGGNTGRNAYVQAVANEYRTFRNPVTGKEMDYSATVQLKLRAKVREDLAHPELDDEVNRKDRKKSGRSYRHVERDRERERAHIETAFSSPTQMLWELLAQHTHVVVIGDVGSGKSTLLKRIAHDAATSYFQTTQVRLPIITTATRLGRAAIEHSDLSLAAIVALMQQDDIRYNALRQTINRTVSEAIYRGTALLLIDGLDEANANEQTAVFRLLTDIRTNQAVLASRPSAYSNHLTGWQIADLQQLELDQRRELVFHLFQDVASELKSPPDKKALVVLTDNLLKELRGRESDLAAWAGNPLLLTLTAIRYMRDRGLPENRAGIYELVLEDLQRQRQTDAGRYLPEEEFKAYLRQLALKMTDKIRLVTTIAEVRDIYLANSPISTQTAREILERSGVLQRDARVLNATSNEAPIWKDNEDDLYEFIHPSFREYLAACALAEMPQRNDLARRHCLHQAWEQVLVLLVNRLDLLGRTSDGDEIVRTLIRADRQHIKALGGTDPTHLALRIATRCALSRGKRTSDALFGKLQDAWLPIWRSEERRLLTARGFIQMLDVNGLGGDIAITPWVETIPTALCEGIPLLVQEAYPHRRFSPSNGWVVGINFVLFGLCMLYFVAQTTLNSDFLISTNWGHRIIRVLPTTLLVSLCLIVLMRFYGGFAARSRTRREMLQRGIMATAEEQFFMQLGDRAPVESLLEMLHDWDWSVRLAAVLALGQLGDRAPVESLLEMLHDRSHSVRVAARDELIRLGNGTSVELLDPEFIMQPTAQESEQPQEFFPSDRLVAMLLDADLSVRLRRTAYSLGLLDDRVPVDLLLVLLRDRSRWVRFTAAYSLGQLGDRVPIEPLLEMLRDEDSNVQEAAVETLGQLGNQAPVELLVEMLRDSHSSVRQAAVRALGRLGNRAPLAILLAILHDDDQGVRFETVRALGLLSDRVPVESLIEMLRDTSRWVRLAAVYSLGQLGKRAPINLLAKMLHDDDSGVRSATVQVLAPLELSLEQVMVLYHTACHPQGWWRDAPLRLVHWITDWPVLLGIIAAQVTLVWPGISIRVPVLQSVEWLFSFTAWWQILIIVTLYAAAFVITSYLRARVMYGKYRQDEQAAMLNVLESVLRRQVVDIDSKSLADNSE